MKLPKIHLACSTDELRPAMNHVTFINGHAVATNGHILVIYKLNKFFSEDDLKILEGKFIHRNAWKLVSGKAGSVESDGIVVLSDKVRSKVFFTADELKFPKVAELVKEKDAVVECDDPLMGIDSKWLNIATEISGSRRLHILNKGLSGWIINTLDNPHVCFVVMPLALNLDDRPQLFI